ncbi:recombinase family protein [Catenuloplanes atrovinosus]|uniref:DNA invertase Pin-like site-specific DNA recombinase n=1 Tax=Catenuloplanes atrovinosus TaxID=137266 RepID=A0AAE3YW95_9ACTN|nr:recombinase family protein [Catenuloplanes atrovinosus]MDR7280880.1 DNA invertase Pin-like site-specific DNA recombinase [Catenuloplanes atrovinosus]
MISQQGEEPLNKPRALGVVRLSVSNENQTGEETQRRRITKRAESDEMEMVGWAVDIDVSGSTSPWMRPSIGNWLTNRKDEFDHIIVLKIDRIARSVRHLTELMEWCSKHGKGLISCEEGFDLSKPWGKVVVQILAVVAEAELDAITARIRASREAMRQQGRWPGGLVPFGRRSVKGSDGFTLELDPEYGPVLKEMIRRFIDTPSFSGVAQWLNEQEIPTVQDIARLRSARGESTTRLIAPEARGRKWLPNAVQAILTNRSLLGEYQTADGSVLRGDDGAPIMRSQPVLGMEEWAVLQDAVNSVKYKKPRGSSSALLGVAFCLTCGNPLYFTKAEPARSRKARYRCHGNKSKGQPACKGAALTAERLYAWLEELLLIQIGDLEIMESVTKAGDDEQARKLAIIDGEMNQLTKEFRAGRLEAVAYASQVAQLANDREQALKAGKAKPVTQWVPTGETYGNWWKRSTEEERREFLTRRGFKAYAGMGLLVITPGDLLGFLEQRQAISFGDVPAEAFGKPHLWWDRGDYETLEEAKDKLYASGFFTRFFQDLPADAPRAIIDVSDNLYLPRNSESDAIADTRLSS